MVRSLAALAADAGTIRSSVDRLSDRMSTLTWIIPTLVAFGIAVIAVIVGLK